MLIAPGLLPCQDEIPVNRGERVVSKEGGAGLGRKGERGGSEKNGLEIDVCSSWNG